MRQGTKTTGTVWRHGRQCLFVILSIGLTAGLVGLNGSLATEPAPPEAAAGPTSLPPHPIWTLVPTHIDPATEHHIRIAPETDDSDRMLVSVDHPIHLGADGTFEVDHKPMQIFGIVLPERGKLCETRGGSRWACGVRSQAMFISLLAAKVLDCRRLSPLGATVTVVNCKSGSDDIAERMVRDGWATTDEHAGVNLKSIEAVAQKDLRGLWRQTVPEF